MYRVTAPAGSGLALCDETGMVYSGVTESAGAPEEPREGALWLDLSGTEPVLRQYSREVWTALEGVCVKVQATGIGTGFAAGDGVEVSGCSVARLNGETVLQLKSTPLVATITVIDVYAVISKVRQETYITYEPLLLLALIYLCLTAILVVAFRYFESKIPTRGA